MKRKVLFAAALLLAAQFSRAQTGVFDVREESNPDGALLTTEEIVYGKGYVRHKRHSLPHGNSGTPHFFERGGSVFFVRDASSGEELIAEGGNGIVYGQAVSRYEFGISGGIFICPADSMRVAFYRKDESRVTEFPLLDISTRTGSLKSVRYPMNGMDSELIDLMVYNRADGSLVRIECTDFSEERYLTNISWGGTEYIYVHVLDREQHNMHLNMYDAGTGKFIRTVLTEQDDRWTEPLDPVRFFNVNDTDIFIYRTDNRDSYRNLYLCDSNSEIRRLTKVDADVEFVGIDGDYVYYTSAQDSPVQNQLYRIRVSGRRSVKSARIGRPERLTPERGWHSIFPDSYIDDSGNWRMGCYDDIYSAFNDPGCYRRCSVDGTVMEVFSTPEDPLEGYASCEVDFGTVKSSDGQYDNYYRLFKPLGFDPSKKYPAIVYVYGGPHSQMVQDRWLGGVRMWEMYMAQRGYVVYVQDNRGTQNRGEEFEKAINRQCGQLEMQDQMAGVEMLKSQSWVDSTRIGVGGWSYGGFMTISLATNYPETFKVAVAGGPVIDWKWYEVMYGERYMDTPETNPEGFEKTSLVNAAANLKGRLLICQGAIDQTVLWQHSLSFVQKCIEEGILLDYFPYPRTEHNVGGNWRAQMYDKITDYYDRNL